MSSSVEPYNLILNIESSEPTHITSSGVRDVSGSDHAVNLASDCPNYKWVDPRVLDVPICFRAPTALDCFYLMCLS